MKECLSHGRTTRARGPSAEGHPAPQSLRDAPAQQLSRLQQTATRPPPPPRGGDLRAPAPGPLLTEVAAPQPGRVLQPEGPFPHVPQQVWAGATPRHGSARLGEEGRPPRGGGEEGEETRGSTPEPHRDHPRAGSLKRSESDGSGGGGSSAFACEVRPYPGWSSLHTLLLRLPRTTRDQQQSPPSAPPPEGGGGGGLDSSLSSFSTPALPNLSREMTTTGH